jgi:hypothetical protein
MAIAALHLTDRNASDTCAHHDQPFAPFLRIRRNLSTFGELATL